MPTTTTTTRNGKSAVPLTASQKRDSHKQVEAMQELGVVPQWDSVAELRQLKFDKLVALRVHLHKQIEDLTEQKKNLDRDLMAALTVSGAEKVLWEERQVQIVHSKSGDKIVAEKLLLNGVAPDVIRDSTEPGKSYDYLLVGRPK